MTGVIEMLRIRVETTTEFICLARHEHHAEFLGAFVGFELDAVPDPENETLYRVSVGEVEKALRQKTGGTMAVVYWTGHWHRTQHLLDDPVYFPKSCCVIVT